MEEILGMGSIDWSMGRCFWRKFESDFCWVGGSIGGGDRIRGGLGKGMLD